MSRGRKNITFDTKLKLPYSKPTTVILFFPDDIVHLRGQGIRVVVQGKDSAWKVIDLINTEGLVADLIARAIASILRNQRNFVLNNTDVEILGYDPANYTLYVGIKPSFKGLNMLLEKANNLLAKKKQKVAQEDVAKPKQLKHCLKIIREVFEESDLALEL